MIQHFVTKNQKSIWNVLIVSVLIFGVTACTAPIKKSEFSGGTLNLAITNAPLSYIPFNVNDFYSAIVLNQIFEGLISLNVETMELEPCLVRSWEISEDGKQIAFTLRDSIYFQTNANFKKKVKLTPQDVIYSIQLACRPYDNLETYAYTNLYKANLVGAIEYFIGEADSIDGLRVEGNKIIFQLKNKNATFLYQLAQTTNAIVSKEIFETLGESYPLGTGPFQFSGLVKKDGVEKIVLLRNENFHKKDNEGCQLPYLDSLCFYVIKDEQKQLEWFKSSKIQLLDDISGEVVQQLFGEEMSSYFNGTPPKYKLIRKPLIATEFYYFNLTKEVFENVNVRKAINFAINRDEIAKNAQQYHVLNASVSGIVPQGFGGYDYQRVKQHSYGYYPEIAKSLMRAAGYENGNNFPELELVIDQGKLQRSVAEEIKQQLKEVLNIEVKIKEVSFHKRLELQENIQGDIFRMSWFADYYNPENFLMLAYGKAIANDNKMYSKINYPRYNNPLFDANLNRAKEAIDIINQYKFLADAEVQLMEDAPFIILWYEEALKVMDTKIRNMHFNAMNYYNFKDVYLKSWTKNEWEALLD